MATSYNKRNSIEGEYPNLSINYNKLKLSSGTSPLAEDIQISQTDDSLKVSWNPIHQWAGDQHDDLVMIALYHPKDKNASLFLNAGKRSEGACFLDITDENLRNEPIEAYLCFKSADGETISDSVYLGNINGSQEKKAEEKIDKEYTDLKNRLEKVKADYHKREARSQKTGIITKSLKAAKKEYEVLKERLKNLPGKPV